MFVNILEIDIQYHIIRLFYHTRKEHCFYFVIPTSNENNLIYLFITQKPEGDIKNTVFVVTESRSIFYSSKIVYLQIDWFTGYNGIMTEH